MKHHSGIRVPALASLLIFASAAGLLLAGCGSGSNGDASPSTGAPATPQAQVSLSCADMANMSIPADQIGLPTKGAVVTATQTMRASGSGATAIGEHCVVMGDINPVDTNAPKIKFQLNLPAAWNSKVLMFGGGGFDGTIPSPAANVPAGSPDKLTPLGRGYATFASDSGHQAKSPDALDGSFALNDEALNNYSRDALKKTRDAAFFLLKARYGVNGPQKAYFAGGSTGGREALAVVQNWPQDWDGAIVLYPAWNVTSLTLQSGRIARAFAEPGAYPNAAKRRQLLTAAIQTCDSFDSVLDGLISNVKACNAVFDPATATVNGVPLRCASGIEGGNNCLSDAQIAALRVFETPITFKYGLASGETLYPGFNVWESDLDIFTFGLVPPASPMPATAPYASIFWDQWVRYFVTRVFDFNSLGLNPEQPGRWQDRISALTATDATKSDLSAFQTKGGKLLLAHGTADAIVSTRASEQYYERLQNTMGAAKVDGFVRFYEIPGYGHGFGSQFNAAWDSLTALENWVEHGTAPAAQIVTDITGVPGRTRPLCDYPNWPKYKGSGDINLAASFACTTQ